MDVATTEERDLGGFIFTWSGKKFHPLHPEELEIDIKDIAHALARNNRYGGHLDCEMYSVAQHSVLVAKLLQGEILRSDESWKKYLLQALLHDASEAYMMDMPSPIKKLLPDFKRLEDRLQAHIMRTFGLPVVIHPDIKKMDVLIRISEAHCLSFGWDVNPFLEGVSLENATRFLNYKILPVDSRTAERMFLDAYQEITASRD